jgi:2-dehydro-3-deoxyphosphogluconate aldolase/(4S)-4-hydroxy-2-oxoglutarate aldolase
LRISRVIQYKEKKLEIMKMPDISKKLGELRVVPVIVLDDAENAVPLAEALVQGGLPCAEVTFRTAAAAESIKRISKYEDILLGAGTVLTIDQAKEAMDSGAQFIVTPGFNPKVVGYCVENGISITPGVCTPTQIEMALEFGLEVLKFFPAEAFGGLKTLKAISAPYGMVRFVPTGGIHAGNICDYLAFDKVVACGGSWMVKKDLISNGKYEEITALVKEAVALVKG